MENVKTVEKVKSKKDTRSNFQKVGFYMSIIYIALTGLFLMQMFKLNVLPNKYSIIVAVVLTILALALTALQIGRRVNKVNRVLGKVLIVILSCALGFGNYLLYSAGETFNKLTKEHVDTTVVSVVVMKDSEVKELSQLNGELIGLLSIGDLEKQTNA